MLPKRLSFLDIETTGTRLTYDRIIEVGIITIELNQNNQYEIIKTFNSLVNPNSCIPSDITNITGITTEDVSNAPSFREVSVDILDCLDASILVAHNVRFDYGFLKHEFSRLEKTFSMKHFCTVKLSRKLFPRHPHHNLDALIERFNISCQRRHRAFDDANVLFSFFQYIHKNVNQEELVNAINSALKKPSTPIKLSEEILNKLPESPGVYIFYGLSDIPLYIGKSINIKERVLSHFAGDYLSFTEMKIAQQVESIEIIQTSGELGALFTESTLIKKLKPLYNRKLRRSQKLVVLKETFTQQGFKTVMVEEVEKISAEDLDKILGIFKTKKQTKDFLYEACEKYLLCPKILGLENFTDSCFKLRLGKCKGACIEKEKAVLYNLRFTLAFMERKIRSWPFNGAILYEENNPTTGEKEYFLIDKWCYLGSIKSKDYIFS
ncbi:MAG: polymerase III, epsilon subunit protein [Candidatus Daviesbacteria bacterium GW2011_GWA1_38_7]|nr:MAG: polymerase III, epsilon subunit protein [Candidatus Daviesbacteria bacterium GW2011_GWA1_38_7]